MKRFFAFLTFVALAMPTWAQEAADEEITLDIREAATVVLDEFLWQNRVLVVFANSPIDPNFRKQIDLFNERPEPLLDRDVVVVTDTNADDPSAIRIKLRPRGFGFVLIDKDGVVKLRKPSPWDVREITRSIDKTELRQQEVRDARNATN